MKTIINAVWKDEKYVNKNMERFEEQEKKEFIQNILLDEGIPNLNKVLKELKN